MAKKIIGVILILLGLFFTLAPHAVHTSLGLSAPHVVHVSIGVVLLVAGFVVGKMSMQKVK